MVWLLQSTTRGVPSQIARGANQYRLQASCSPGAQPLLQQLVGGRVLAQESPHLPHERLLWHMLHAAGFAACCAIRKGSL